MPPVLQSLFNTSAMFEALKATFYYRAIKTPSGFFAAPPTTYQRYLRLILDAEWSHYRRSVDQHGGVATQTTFYFKAESFAAGHFVNFLAKMPRLEEAMSAFYLAAIRQMAEMDEPRLAAVIGQLALLSASIA